MSVQPASPRQLRLGLFVQALGHHVGGWRAEGAKGSPLSLIHI